MTPPDTPAPTLATLSPAPARRVVAVAVLGLSGLILLWLTATYPPREPLALVFLVALGAGLLWVSWRVWTVTERALVLTTAGLYDDTGRCLFETADVTGVDRGVFAFKPSGGFLVHLSRAPGRAWSPGLWWRFGRVVGVGGVTPAMQGKFMAEMLAMHLEKRAQVEKE